MAETYLATVNKVLRRLREDTVTSVTDTSYSTLIGEFVNQAKEEAEDAWYWGNNRSNVTFTLAGDSTTIDYSLTGTNKKTKIFAIYDTTEESKLKFVDRERVNQWDLIDDWTAVDNPSYWTDAGLDGSAQKKVRVFPYPSSSNSMRASCYIPQAELTSDSDMIMIPILPIILRAYALAISERGEDGGEGFSEADGTAQAHLADAILMDQQLYPFETDWSSGYLDAG